MKTLKEVSLDNKNIRIITNLYWNQTACMKLHDYTTKDVKILRGVKQDYILSPLIFNIYSEKIFIEALNEAEEGKQIYGPRINYIMWITQ